MTGDIVRVESFSDIPVRVVTHLGQAMIPLNDIADGITHDRSGLRKLYHRNEEIVGKWSGEVNLATPGGTQKQICLNHDGVTAILMKVDFARIKDPVRRKRIIDFQDWAALTLSKAIKQEVVPAPAPVHSKIVFSEDVREALKIARIIADETGCNILIAQSFALEKCGAGEWQKLLPAATMTTGYLTPTDIGNRIGKTAWEVNQFFYNHKPSLQLHDSNGNGWRLTEAGKEYAEEFPFTKNGHSGYQIKWKENVLRLMNVPPQSNFAEVSQ